MYDVMGIITINKYILKWSNKPDPLYVYIDKFTNRPYMYKENQ